MKTRLKIREAGLQMALSGASVLTCRFSAPPLSGKPLAGTPVRSAPMLEDHHFRLGLTNFETGVRSAVKGRMPCP